MADAGAKITVKVLSIAIGIPVGIATRKLIERTWQATGATGRPRRPTDDNVAFADAVAWGALSAVGVVIADLVTRRSAEAVYSAITGNQAPPGKASKADKKLDKAAEKAKLVEKD
ncbi:DUF4235 domain-containing protein [uncultured Jatrophihabitans sp.]|uniref:DUF4235 domain-containing protein n=1 Tax=uncultured Jatrophihabitans sp. TaxID=1610747 RepID=UPI0035C9FB38